MNVTDPDKKLLAVTARGFQIGSGVFLDEGIKLGL
jgi:hypothetical protein